MSFRLGEVVGIPPEVAGSQWTSLKQVVAGIHTNGHKKVLVVGVRGDNVTPEQRAHPQLLFWEKEEAERGVVPAAAHLVLVTRFISHPVYERLKTHCHKVGIAFGSHPIGTGQLKELLKPFMPEEQEKETGMITEADRSRTVKSFARGALQDFARQHGDLDAAPAVLEIRRLVELAATHGYETSFGAMNSAFYRLKELRSAAAAAPVVAVPAKPVTAAVTQKLAGVMDDDVEILRMIDDVRAAMELIRQAVATRSSKRMQLRELLKDI